MAGGEQDERDRDDRPRPGGDEVVDRLVDERLGELDEAEAERQVAGGLADVAGELVELLQAVGVAGAVPDDEQR
jgi:hypothetical protein